mgnify:CR=1 FL=1
MKVTVSVGGTFHAFQLAGELERRGYLHRLVTTHRPLRGEGVSRGRIVANPLPELFLQVPRRLHLPMRGDYLKAQSFDWWARRHVDGCDLLVGFAAFSLHTIRAAKAQDTVTVLERASAHILSQRTLLEEEYRRFGRTAPPMDPRLVQKQLWEYGEADYIAVPSTFVYNTFLEHGFPAQRLINVPLGADTRQFSPGPQGDGPFRVLAAGISLQKGTPYVLDAVRRLARPGAELTFLGGMGPDVADVLAGYQGRYRWPGFVGQAQLAGLMRQGSVFVQASIQEGFGLMIPQAMAAGLPVICTTNTAGPDLVREGVEGFIVPIRDPEALCERLRYLADHLDVRRRMGEAAAARAQEFTWDAYGDRISAEYRRLVDRAHAAAVTESRPDEFYDYFWHISDVWETNTGWDEPQFRRHFAGVLRPGDTVLDIGCGDARAYQAKLMEVAREVHGIDISERAVARARAKGVLAKVHDLSENLPYEDETFDVVVCFEVLEHLFDPKHAVREIRRILRPGGRLVASVPNAGYFRDRLAVLTRGEVLAGVTDFANPWKAPHIRFFTKGSLTALLRASGLEVEWVRSKADPSLFDGLEVFGGVGRFLARQLQRRLPAALRGAFLGNRWPAVFAPGLIVLARRPGRGR